MSTDPTQWTAPLGRASNTRGAQVAALLAEAKRVAQERRARVLRHEDLAQRLTEPPLSYARPDQWNGYVPPTTNSSGRANTSPSRAALVEICAEALRRETAAPEGERDAS